MSRNTKEDGLYTISTKKKLDYFDKFATFVKPVSYKCLFAIWVKEKLKIRNIDVVTIFFNDYLDKIIYVI